MKVSIVMPCYNSEKTISRSINSIVEQSYHDLELIIVDDGSTDGTSKILDEYCKQHKWILVINQPNSGKPSIARNRGIKKIKGDILCFLDADDSFELNRLSEIVQCFKNHPDCSVVFNDRKFINQNNEIQVESFVNKRLNKSAFDYLFDIKLAQDTYSSSSRDLYKKQLLTHILPHTSSIAVRVNDYSVNELLFDEEYTCYEDLDLWLYWISKRKTIYLDKVLSSYYDTDQSVTKNLGSMYKDSIRFHKRHYEKPLYRLTFIDKLKLRKKIFREYGFLAYLYERQKKYLLSIRESTIGFFWYPNIKYIFFAGKTLIRYLSSIHTR